MSAQLNMSLIPNLTWLRPSLPNLGKNCLCISHLVNCKVVEWIVHIRIIQKAACFHMLSELCSEHMWDPFACLSVNPDPHLTLTLQPQIILLKSLVPLLPQSLWKQQKNKKPISLDHKTSNLNSSDSSRHLPHSINNACLFKSDM